MPDNVTEQETAPAPAASEEETPVERRFSLWRVVPLLAALLVVGIWFWKRREPFSATKAYRLLRAMSGGTHTGHRGPGRGAGAVPVWVGPLRVEDTLNRRYPQVVDETRCIVSHYVRESFADEQLSPEEVAEVRAALAGVKEKLKRTA